MSKPKINVTTTQCDDGTYDVQVDIIGGSKEEVESLRNSIVEAAREQGLPEPTIGHSGPVN